jgi:hypothetical protein
MPDGVYEAESFMDDDGVSIGNAWATKRLPDHFFRPTSLSAPERVPVWPGRQFRRKPRRSFLLFLSNWLHKYFLGKIPVLFPASREFCLERPRFGNRFN